MFSFLVATLVAVHLGCTQPVHQSTVAAPIRESAERVRERVEASFERAIFYKPREDSMAGLEMTFAPLIVQEVAGGVGPTDPTPFGTIVREGGGPHLDPSRPTLYAGTFTTRINGVDHDQVVFFWRYPPRPDSFSRSYAQTLKGICADGSVSREGRGVRITLGSNGFPLVWEALSTATDTRELYVSESLERAAVREFGGPLPGRRYAVERPISPTTHESWGDHSMDEARNVVVARLLDDGPVPMGPYVYLNAPPQRAITTVLCRCMPSQVSEFVETSYYDLVTLEAIKPWGDTRSCIDPPEPRVHWGGTLSYWNLYCAYESLASTLKGVAADREETPLEQLLRWPKM